MSALLMLLTCSFFESSSIGDKYFPYSESFECIWRVNQIEGTRKQESHSSKNWNKTRENEVMLKTPWYKQKVKTKSKFTNTIGATRFRCLTEWQLFCQHIFTHSWCCFFLVWHILRFRSIFFDFWCCFYSVFSVCVCI